MHEYRTGEPLGESSEDAAKQSEAQIRRVQVANSQLIQEILLVLKTELQDCAEVIFNLAGDSEEFNLKANRLAIEARVIKKVINLIENDKYE